MNEGLIVVSPCDGMSCGQLALKRAGIKVDKYYASEIKKTGIDTTMKHFPNTIQLGDMTNIKYINGLLYTENGIFNIGKVDLLIGGTPCQDFSILKDINHETRGLNGDKSKLFYEYLRLLKEIKPKYFLLENVRMKKDSEKELNIHLGVEGIHINSELVSFASRPRIYWTNIPGITQPKDKNINFQDYKDTDFDYCKQFKVNKTPSRIRMWNDGKGRETIGNCNNITNAKKIGCITRKQDRFPNAGLIEFDGFCRYLTRREIELAQNLPLGYTEHLSYGQMQDLCGDGWTIDVIAHIFSFLEVEKDEEE